MPDDVKAVETVVDGMKVLNLSGKYQEVAAKVDSLINKPKGYADLMQQPLATGWACISLNNYSHGAEATLTFDPAYSATTTGSRHETTYTIRGHRVSVSLKVAAIMREYHPTGYGTAARPEKVIEGDIIEVVVRRGNSCD